MKGGKKWISLQKLGDKKNEWIKSTQRIDIENKNNSIVMFENKNNAEINNENVVIWRESIRNDIMLEVKAMIIDNNQNISEAVDEKLRENKEEILNTM